MNYKSYPGEVIYFPVINVRLFPSLSSKMPVKRSRVYTEEQKNRKRLRAQKNAADRAKKDQEARARANKDLSLDDALRGADTDEKLSSERVRIINDKLKQMSDEDLTRFEFFYRSHFQKDHIKMRLEASLPHRAITDEMAIVVGGLTKLFVGELVETAMLVHREFGSSGALECAHIEEAARRLQQEGKFGRVPERSFLFSPRGLRSESLLSDPDAEICQIPGDLL